MKLTGIPPIPPCCDWDTPLCGGVTDNTDRDAPKHIASKNIVDFAARFFIHDRYDPARPCMYSIGISAGEGGGYVLTVSGAYNHKLAVDSGVLEGVQAIIDKYALVQMNGAGRVTAGLPPEFGPWMLRAEYDSGEKLYFCENGMPDAEWTAAFRDFFVGVMAEAGFADALPPKESVTIKKFSVAFNIGAEYRSYALGLDAGRHCLLHYAYDMDTQEVRINTTAALSTALLEGLQRWVIENGMDALETPYSDLKSTKEGFLKLHITYESGRQLCCDRGPDALPPQWPEMRSALVEYLDSYIRENPAGTAAAPQNEKPAPEDAYVLELISPVPGKKAWQQEIKPGDVILDKGYELALLPASLDRVKIIEKEKLTNEPQKPPERLLRIKLLRDGGAVAAVLHQNIYYEGDVRVTEEYERLLKAPLGEIFTVNIKMPVWDAHTQPAYSFVIYKKNAPAAPRRPSTAELMGRLMANIGSKPDSKLHSCCQSCGYICGYDDIDRAPKFCPECGTRF